jgi:hypothetical protein
MNAQDYLNQARELRRQAKLAQRTKDLELLAQAHTKVVELVNKQDRYLATHAQRILRTTKELTTLAKELATCSG